MEGMVCSNSRWKAASQSKHRTIRRRIHLSSLLSLLYRLVNLRAYTSRLYVAAPCCGLNKAGSRRINVTFGCVRVTIVAVKSIKHYIFWVCVCSLGYPAYREHLSYYIVICGMPRSGVFFQIMS